MNISMHDNRCGTARGALKCRRAFTLAELMVVMVIALAVSLAAVGSYANLRRSRSVKTAAEAIQALFVGARAYAVTTNSTYRVVFQLKNPTTSDVNITYWIDETYASDQTPIFGLTQPDEAKTPKISTPERLTEGVDLVDLRLTRLRDPKLPSATATVTPASASYAVVRFFPDGSSDDALLRLMPEGNTTPVGNPRAWSVRLQAATAKPRLIEVAQP